MEVNLVTEKYLYKTEVRTYSKGICKTDPIAKKEPEPLPRLPEYEDISFFRSQEFLDEIHWLPPMDSYHADVTNLYRLGLGEYRADSYYYQDLLPDFHPVIGWCFDRLNPKYYDREWKGFRIDNGGYQYYRYFYFCSSGDSVPPFIPDCAPMPAVWLMDGCKSYEPYESTTGYWMFDTASVPDCLERSITPRLVSEAVKPEVYQDIRFIIAVLLYGEDWEKKTEGKDLYFATRGADFLEFVINTFELLSQAQDALTRCRSNGKSLNHRLGLMEDRIIEQHEGRDYKSPSELKHELARDMNPASRRSRCPYCSYGLDLETNKYGWQWDLSPTEAQRAQGLESNPDAVKAYSKARERSRENSRRRSLRAVSDLAYSNGWDYFVTLTLSPETTDRYDYNKCANIVSSWLKLMRKENPNLRYIVVPEQHEDGAWHFHALMSGCSGMEFTDSGHKDRSGRIIYNVARYTYGFTTATKIAQDPVEQENAVRYLLKYLTKTLDETLQYRKRYWASRNLKKPVKMEYFAKDLDDAVGILSEHAAEHRHIEMEKDEDGYGTDMVLDIFVFRGEYHDCDTYTMLTSLGIDLDLARSIPPGMTKEEAIARLEAA